jgi:hypothetical protein
MLLRSVRCRRRAASLAESVITYSVVFMLMFGITIVAMGVYSYQQVAALAREGARWASVHGGQYNAETGNAMATQTSIYNTAILPKAVGLDTNQLSATASWTNANEMPINLVNGAVVTNQVTVTVTYQWNPLLYLGSMTLQSTSVATMQY